jgi:uncharacterized protein YajQ (UPF0234 family)
MASFDVVSEINEHEFTNAVDQANKEVTTRFDFKGTDSKYEFQDDIITIFSQTDFQVTQMLDILKTKLVKRKIDLKFIEPGTILESGKGARQDITVKQGINKEIAKKMVKVVKDKKMKVQAAIQGEKLRVTGKKRDDLQDVINLFKETDFGIPLQFENYRD